MEKERLVTLSAAALTGLLANGAAEEDVAAKAVEIGTATAAAIDKASVKPKPNK
jgi:hypothetical protein